MPPSPAPSASSPSAGSIFLDRPAALQRLRELARGLAERDARVCGVVLFGSLATGRATVRSDADLLIVLREHGQPPRERIPDYLLAFLDAPMPVDVLPFTVAELETRRRAGDRFVQRVDAEGIELLGSEAPKERDRERGGAGAP